MLTELYAVEAQGGVPGIGGGLLADRPDPGQSGRLYLVVEASGNYWCRDTSVSWVVVAGQKALAKKDEANQATTVAELENVAW